MQVKNKQTELPHVPNLIYKLLAVFSIYQTPEQTGQGVTLQEMNSISCNYFYLIEVGVKYARAANPTAILLSVHFSMHVIDVS